MKSIITNRNIRIYTKINIIWSILRHGFECWALTKDLHVQRRLGAAEMWYNRRIMRISWTEKKSNEVKRRSNGNGPIQKIPTQNHEKKTLKYFGHINRAHGLERHRFVAPKAERDNTQNTQTV